MSTGPAAEQSKSWTSGPGSGLLAVWNIPGNIWRGALRAGSLTVWMRFGAALMATAITIGLILIIWQGPWTLAVQAKRLDWLGFALMAMIFTIVICVVALFDMKVGFSASRDGVKADVSGDRDETPVVQTTTTTTTAVPL